MYDPKPIDMSDALRQVYEGKKLDPVGQEDKDIDNDGDHDKSDKYLLNRRKVRGAAIKTRKEEVEEILDSLNEEQLDVVLEFIAGKKGDGYIGHPNLDLKNPLAKTQTKGPVGNKTGSGMVHRVGGMLGDRKMQLDKARGLSKGGPVKKEEVIHELSQLTEEQLNELLGGVVGGLMNMGKKGGFMKGASTGIGGLAGQAMGKKGGIKGLLGFSKGGEKKKVKKEALAFSAEEELFIEQCDFDDVTDEELVAFFEDAIIELAEDDQDLLEICEELELCGILMEEEERDAGAEARERLKNKKKPSNLERLKAAAAKAGERLKKGAKAVIGAGARAAGHAAGEFQAQRKKSKKAAMERGKGDGEKKKSDDDGDKTGGKLDDILSSIRNDAKGQSDSGGGSSSASSGGGGKKKPGFIQRVGSALKGALKKGVGKLSRAVSKGSDRLATRLGEDYEQIAHLYESGLFTIQEIENVIEEGYKEIDKKKENKMYRRAGNLAREGLSAKDKKKKEKALKKSDKIVSSISRQKERERFSKMADIKARDNYEG